jgi:hypothetical protein
VNPVQFLFDVEGLVVRKFKLFPDHVGNDDHTIGVRDAQHPGQCPSFFAERRRLGDTELQALERSRDLLEQRDATILREINVLRKQREQIAELRRQLKAG